MSLPRGEVRCGSDFVCLLSCGAVRCGAVRCCAVLCCVVLCSVVLSCAVRGCPAVCCVVLCCVVWCSFCFSLHPMKPRVAPAAPHLKNIIAPWKAPQVWGCVRIRQHFSSLNGYRRVFFHSRVYFCVRACVLRMSVFVFRVALRFLPVSCLGFRLLSF